MLGVFVGGKCNKLAKVVDFPLYFSLSVRFVTLDVLEQSFSSSVLGFSWMYEQD